VIHLATLAQSSAQSGQPPAQIVPGGGTVDITLTVLEISGSGSRLVNAGIPLQEAQLTNVNNAALWLNTGGGLVEVSCYVASLAPHLDGSVRSLLVQWTGDPDDITAAELRLGAAVGVARDDPTTCPARPAATLMPSSTHLIACDLFPFTVIPAASVHADYSDYAALFSDMGYFCLVNGDIDWNKYARAMWCFYWIAHNGPAVTNADTFFDVGCQAALASVNQGVGSEFSEVDNAGTAIHYLLTGYTGSRTLTGLYGCLYATGAGWYFGYGGRGIFHAAEAIMYCYLLDINDVSRSGNGPFTKAQWISGLATLVSTWDAEWSVSGTDPTRAGLPTPVEGIHSPSPVSESTYVGPDGVLPYMVGMMHCGVMRAFKRLDGESATLDNLRTAWETALLNACDVILNDADGYDGTNGNDCFAYALYAPTGTSDIRWTDGGNVLSGDWHVNYTAAGDTTTTSITSTGAFANVETGALVWNATRNAVRVLTKTNDDTATMAAITGQTSGDSIWVRENDFASHAFPTANWEMWHAGFVVGMYWYAKDAASGAQQIEFQNAARTATLGLVTGWDDGDGTSHWGNIRDGSYYVNGAGGVDQNGVNAGLQWLAACSEWLEEGVQS